VRPRRAGSARRTDADGTTAAAVSTLRLPLAYYPTDETLSERLVGVVGEWDSLRRGGIGKFLSDEFELSERLMLGDADLAVRNANDVMGRDGASSSSGGGEGDGGYLLREGLCGRTRGRKRCGRR
jgi:hypothetical protein